MRDYFEQIDLVLRPRQELSLRQWKDALLALHSILTKRLSIPSALFYKHSTESINTVYRELTFSSVDDIGSKRLQLLCDLGLKLDQIQQNSISLNAVAMELVTEVISNTYNNAKVIYDPLRVSPFLEDDLFNLTKNFAHCARYATYGTLDVLRIRHQQSIEWQLEHNPILFPDKNFPYRKDILGETYQSKLELLWKNIWGNNEKYQLPSQHHRILNALYFTEAI